MSASSEAAAIRSLRTGGHVALCGISVEVYGRGIDVAADPPKGENWAGIGTLIQSDGICAQIRV